MGRMPNLGSLQFAPFLYPPWSINGFVLYLNVKQMCSSSLSSDGLSSQKVMRTSGTLIEKTTSSIKTMRSVREKSYTRVERGQRYCKTIDFCYLRTKFRENQMDTYLPSGVHLYRAEYI